MPEKHALYEGDCNSSADPTRGQSSFAVEGSAVEAATFARPCRVLEDLRRDHTADNMRSGSPTSIFGLPLLAVSIRQRISEHSGSRGLISGRGGHRVVPVAPLGFRQEGRTSACRNPALPRRTRRVASVRRSRSQLRRCVDLKMVRALNVSVRGGAACEHVASLRRIEPQIDSAEATPKLRNDPFLFQRCVSRFR